MITFLMMMTEMVSPDRPGALPHERSGKSIAGPNSLEEDE